MILSSKPGPACLSLGHDLGSKARLAVARSFHLQLPKLALQGFWALPVARVSPPVAGRVVLLIAKMIGYFGLEGSFQNGFGQFFEQTVLPDDILGLPVVAG